MRDVSELVKRQSQSLSTGVIEEQHWAAKRIQVMARIERDFVGMRRLQWPTPIGPKDYE